MADQVKDDFEAAFAQIAAADAKGETIPQADIKPAEAVVETTKTAEEIAAETAAATEAAKVAADAAAAAAADAAKTPEQRGEEEAAKTAKEAEDAANAAAEAEATRNANLAATVAKTLKQVEADERTAAAAAVAEAARIKAAQPAPQPLVTDDELSKIQAFEKEFPDIAAAQSIIRKAEYNVLTNHIFAEVAKFFKTAIDPIARDLGNIKERTHVGDLQAIVPDYDTLDVHKLDAWIKSLPAYMQGGFNTVMRSGTAEEVKDLVSRFYADTGVKPAAAVPDAAAAAAAKAATDAAEAARVKAARALAPVAGQRTGSVAASAPVDFDGAFAAASREIEKMGTEDRFTR